MKKVWILVVLVLVAVFGGRAWYLNKATTTNKDTVKIGLLSFISGQYAKMGIDFNNGAILAIEELNPTLQQKMSMIIEDGKASAKESVNGFNKLLFSGIDASIVIGDIQMPPVAPLVAQNKVPTIMSIMGNTGYLKYNNEHYMFQIWPSTYGNNVLLGQYAKNDLKLDNVAILKMGSIYGEDGAKGFIDGFGKAPIIVEEFKPDATDLRPLVMKVLEKNPQGIFVVGHGKGYNSVINHIKEYRFSGVLLSDSAINDVQSVENIKDIGGIIFAEAEDFTHNKDFLKFAQRYEKRFNSKPALESAFGYDAIRMLAQAIKNNPADIRKGLSAIKELDTFAGKMTLQEDGSSIFHLSIKKMNADGSDTVIKE